MNERVGDMLRLLGITVAIVAACFCATTARASDLAVTLEADVCNASTIVVGPGCEVVYRVVGELSDSSNQGLAVVVFDLEFDGGALPQADEPTSLPMLNFTPPSGFSRNPSGYGGTPGDGNLIQVGGAQNVFNHGQWLCQDDDDCPGLSSCSAGFCTSIPGLPVGALMTGVASPGSPVVMATGRLIVPASEGTYTLRMTNTKANVVIEGATGDPVWETEATGIGPVTDLSVTVLESALCCGEVVEACCLSDGTCTLVDPVECTDALGGIPAGPDSTCEGDVDTDGVDGTCGDECPIDAAKTVPGLCGCGAQDTDSDADTIPDCLDQCQDQDDRIDIDHNGVPDCLEESRIPTVSEWGLLILTLSFLAASKVYFGRRVRVVAVKTRM